MKARMTRDSKIKIINALCDKIKWNAYEILELAGWKQVDKEKDIWEKNGHRLNMDKFELRFPLVVSKRECCQMPIIYIKADVQSESDEINEKKKQEQGVKK